jgi:HSP20 family protein
MGKDNQPEKGLFGNLFEGLDKLIEMASNLKDAEGKATEGPQEIDLSHLKPGMKAIYGFSIRTGIGGNTTVEPFGNVRKSEKGAKVEAEREPITDVYEEETQVVIVVEMPGVSEADIQATVKGDILEVVAKNKDRNYRKEMLLPAGTVGSGLEKVFTNGILTIRFPRTS